jgi:hypothetical protein
MRAPRVYSKTRPGAEDCDQSRENVRNPRRQYAGSERSLVKGRHSSLNPYPVQRTRRSIPATMWTVA